MNKVKKIIHIINFWIVFGLFNGTPVILADKR